MEIDRTNEGHDPEFEAWARDRMKQMRETAKEVTRELGLPPEKEMTVLRAIFDGPRASGNAGTEATSTRQMPVRPEHERGRQP
jgi:hypothetical protein